MAPHEIAMARVRDGRVAPAMALRSPRESARATVSVVPPIRVRATASVLKADRVTVVRVPKAPRAVSVLPATRLVPKANAVRIPKANHA